VENLASILHVDTAMASTIEATREELAFQIEQLEDFSRSSRVVFFNSQDLDMIKVRKETSFQRAIPNPNPITLTDRR
jgi:hypothetical protein